jgi:pimeloyl-ACP methyl ester carboxylesterase
MQSHTLRLSQRSCRYLEAGEGRPMVLLHAFPLGAGQWLPQLASPPAGWRLIAPDLRGFGGSIRTPLPGGVSMDTYASDVFELMTHLAVADATVAGVSMGGYVALAMVARDPGRISGLVLADTRATADGAEARAARDRMVELVRREGPSGVADEMLGKLVGETSKRERPDLGDTVRRLIEANGPDGIEAAILAMKSRVDHTALLGAIRCPTVVICGAEDVITKPEECEVMSHQIPGATFVRIEGAGHLSNLERPDAFTRAMG